MKKLFLLSSVIVITFSMCKKDKKDTVATITTTAVTNISATGAQSGGTITDDGGSGITKKGICYAIHSDPTVADSVTSDGTGSSSFVSTLKGLNANTTYYVKAYAINAAGTAYGNEVSFKTSAGLSTITTTAVSDVVALSAKSGGNITNDGGAAVTERGVVYSTTSNPTISNFKIVAGAGTGTFSATLTPLASQQTYYVRAYATNSYGTAYGNQVQFNAASANTVTDIDGNVYSYVTLGTQSWTTSNLKVVRYRNGDPIQNGYAAGFTWIGSTTGAYRYPNNDTANVAVYGIVYNQWAIQDSRNIAPAGWHVPSDEEWKTLEKYLGMSQADADNTNWRGTTVAAKLREGGSSGLNLQLGGGVSTISGNPLSWNTMGLFSSATYEPNPQATWFRQIAKVGDLNEAAVYRNYTNSAKAIRLVKD